MHKRTLQPFVLLLLLSAAPVFSQSLEYKVDLTNSRSKHVLVTLVPKKLNAETVTFQMPAWAPGAYSVTNYGRYVQDFQASDLQGRPLAVKQLNDNRWSIANAKSLGKIRYEVADSRKDSTSLWFAMAHIDSNLFFANGTALFGYINDKKNVPSTITYVKPADWELATALDYTTKAQRDCSFSQTSFKAKDYDELADAPVMAAPEIQHRCFEQEGALYEIALVSNRDFPMDSLRDYTKRIVKTQTDFFGEIPYNHYTFLYYAPSFMQMPSMGQGALEHMNSSAYLMMYEPWKQFMDGGLRIISHEFFHLWNVKRIHSSLLGPFDYTKGVKTTSLWLSEGITDYYAHALLARNGIIDAEKFLNDVRDWYYQYKYSKPALTKSLEELSTEESDFVMENAVTLYTKGPLVGLMLDAEIRSRTNNKKSLDDVMHALNADAKRKKYFKDADLIHQMEKITKLDLQNFYKSYIAGADSIALEPVLNKLGLTAQFDMSGDLDGSNGASKVEVSTSPAGQVVITKVPAPSLFAQAGFLEGDTVVSINGRSVTPQNFASLLKSIPYETMTKVDVHREESATVSFTPVNIERPRSRVRPLPVRKLKDATALQAAIRTAIMGKMDQP